MGPCRKYGRLRSAAAAELHMTEVHVEYSASNYSGNRSRRHGVFAGFQQRASFAGTALYGGKGRQPFV